MTTFMEVVKTCTVCGASSTHREITSTSAFGSPGLDARPPPPHGYSIDMWIQMCPSCGYCAPDISEQTPRASDIMRSDAYRHRLQDPEFPKLANAFLCHSILEEMSSHYANAAWPTIHAAWACDDASRDDSTPEGHEKRARATRSVASNA